MFNLSFLWNKVKMILLTGTLFLWLFWPSFNASPAAGGELAQRAVINTVYSLCAAAVCSFAMSAVIHKQNKLSMASIYSYRLLVWCMIYDVWFNKTQCNVIRSSTRLCCNEFSCIPNVQKCRQLELYIYTIIFRFTYKMPLWQGVLVQEL